ncbi:MAG: hypothetical protein LBH10_03990 [Burkholderiaceae bacterium]|jgi:hypothetical protein|nr:hypothetical protein [Burkholderiaceae bacterium]
MRNRIISKPIEEFSDDEICLHDCKLSDLASKMFDAFYLGEHERALALARRIAQDATGRVLPS